METFDYFTVFLGVSNHPHSDKKVTVMERVTILCHKDVLTRACFIDSLG